MHIDGYNYHEEKRRLREEKREAKNRRKEEKREEKHRRKEEKREEKQRYREAKNRLRNEYNCGVKVQVAQLLNATSGTSKHNSCNVGYPGNPNVRHTNYSEMPPERIEQDVATIRTIFPDCDPEFIRNCLANEPVDPVRKVTEKLLTTAYPKLAPASSSTLPTAPPLPPRSSFEFPYDEAPPSYEESLEQGQSLKPPPLPKRHQRASSWNGTSSSLPSSRQVQYTNSATNPSSDVSEAISMTVKNILAGFKPSTIESACHKNSHVWTRPVPSNLKSQPLSQQFKISPKDKHSIQKGFSSGSYPSRELYAFHDVSAEDWHFFINGLNSIIGVNSINGSSNNNLGDEFSVSLKWVSWLKVTMDDNMMESNIKSINEYLKKWNDSFFIPRRLIVQFVDDRTPRSSGLFGFKNNYPFVQYLLVKST